jgi:hypothetical protein
MKYYKYLFYFLTIAVLFFMFNCVSYNTNHNEIKSCNYEFLLTNNDLIPSGLLCNGKITDKYGWINDHGKNKFHTGIDFAAPRGTGIYATASGVVISSFYRSDYGYYIKIRHDFGFETLYTHCSQLIAHKGQQVQKGQLIAKVGASGIACENLLHYEISIDGKQIDPGPYMLKINNCKCFLIHFSVINRNYNQIKELVNNIENKKAIDSFGLTPLKIAEILKDNKSIELLR